MREPKKVWLIVLGITWIVLSFLFKPFIFIAAVYLGYFGQTVLFFFGLYLLVLLALLTGILYLGAALHASKLASFLLFPGFAIPLLGTFFKYLLIRRDPSSYDRLALLPDAAYILYILLPELILLAFFGIVFVLFKKRGARFVAVTTAGAYLSLVLIGAGYAHFIVRPASEKDFCDPNRIGSGVVANPYFVEPIAKQELVSILKKYDLKAYRVLLGSKEPGIIQSNFQFDPPVTAEKVEKQFEENMTALSREYATPGAELLIQRFEDGDAVVWSVQFEDAPLSQFYAFLADYEQRQGKLGKVVDPRTGHREVGPGMPIEHIQPLKEGEVTFQCLSK